MVDMERYRELSAKESAGTLTVEEYDEMFQMEQKAIQEECQTMAQLGI